MLNLLLLIVGIVVAFWFVGNVLGFLFMLLVAALVGFTAEAVIPQRQLSHGWIGATGAGLIGSILGNLILGRFGPQVAGIALVPAFLGALILVVAISLFRRNSLAAAG